MKPFFIKIIWCCLLTVGLGCTLLNTGQKGIDNPKTYTPAKGDWALYYVWGNMYIKYIVLSVEQKKVFLMREISTGSSVEKSEQVEIPLNQLRHYISDYLKDIQWSKSGEEIIEINRTPFQAETFEGKKDSANIKYWYSRDIPVSGVLKVVKEGRVEMILQKWGMSERVPKSK